MDNEEEPLVVQLKRTRERIVQDCSLYIGNTWSMGGWALPKSKWANPFRIRKLSKVMNKEQATRFALLNVKQKKWAKDRFGVVERTRVLVLYEKYVRSSPELLDSLEELTGEILGCWCVDSAIRETPETLICHGEILVKLWKESREE